MLATLSQVVISTEAPWNTSGHQKWKGTAEILNAMPTVKAKSMALMATVFTDATLWA